MLLLFTDFGLSGPYTGQMKAVLVRAAPTVPVIDLFADAPAFNPKASAYLLAAFAADFPAGDIFVCVVDPGVGTARRPVILQADGRWFVGPDNGLFAPLVRRARARTAWEIIWRPEVLSATFHGRDLFAPIAARLARGEPPTGRPLDPVALDRPDWPDDLAEIIYIDAYGNAMTGLRTAGIDPDGVLTAAGRSIPSARTFADRAAGTALWYGNSNGLVEIAVNRGRADRTLGVAIGDPVTLAPPPAGYPSSVPR